jgi:hypothetical protein
LCSIEWNCGFRLLSFEGFYVDFAEHAHATRLTNYNHEEDRLLSEQVFAAIQENVRQTFEEVKRIAAEEAEARGSKSRRMSEAEAEAEAEE